ncbi:hypothetical protein ABIE45_000945 [Methylobacterium sp. OAE515]|uniref:hypothetical protein n=1 Tax=Methylobacterium sp. OAE515 TaxID=2817895 RepID=UPI001788E7E8
MSSPRIYVVRSMRPHGNVTYNCPTAEWALKKLRDFTARGDANITALDPDGRPMSEADLIGCIEGSGAASTEDALPAAPQNTRQPAFS